MVKKNRIVQAGGKMLPFSNAKQLGAGNDDLCSVCFKQIRVQKRGDRHLIASLRNPSRNQNLHVYSEGGAVCLSCLIRLLGPEEKRAR